MDVATLAITALASVVAAYVTSKVWAPGTLASAAFTPVLVALVKEALRRPTEVVTVIVPAAVPRRRRRPQHDAPDAPTRVAPAAGAEIPESALAADTPPLVTRRVTGPRRWRWRVALITGLLGFVIAVAVYTVPELLAGAAASGGGSTTLFGGNRHPRARPPAPVTITTVVVPSPTVTVPAPAPAPTPTVTTPSPPATAPPASTTAPAPATPTTTTGTTTTGTTTTPATTIPLG